MAVHQAKGLAIARGEQPSASTQARTAKEHREANTDLRGLPPFVEQVRARPSLQQRPHGSLVAAQARKIQWRSPVFVLHVRICGNLAGSFRRTSNPPYCPRRRCGVLPYVCEVERTTSRFWSRRLASYIVFFSIYVVGFAA